MRCAGQAAPALRPAARPRIPDARGPSGALGYDSTEYPRIRKPGRRARMLLYICWIRGRVAARAGQDAMGGGLDGHAG